MVTVHEVKTTSVAQSASSTTSSRLNNDAGVPSTGSFERAIAVEAGFGNLPPGDDEVAFALQAATTSTNFVKFRTDKAFRGGRPSVKLEDGPVQLQRFKCSPASPIYETPSSSNEKLREIESKPADVGPEGPPLPYPWQLFRWHSASDLNLVRELLLIISL